MTEKINMNFNIIGHVDPVTKRRAITIEEASHLDDVDQPMWLYSTTMGDRGLDPWVSVDGIDEGYREEVKEVWINAHAGPTPWFRNKHEAIYIQQSDTDELDPLDQLRAECRDDRYLGVGDLPQEFVLVQDGVWEHDHKTQHKSLVFVHTPTSRHFEIINGRQGSYHTDWYYERPEVYEVRKEVKMVEQVIWHIVKPGE